MYVLTLKTIVKSEIVNILLSPCEEVAQWLAPQISSANREVGGSSLTVSTDDPLG